jgi:HK97 family phage prohead protease
MADTEIERRLTVSDTSIEYRDVGNGEKRPVIVGYAAVFNSESRNLGGFVEVIHPNAFDEVLATNPDVIGVYNHSKDKLLARSANNTLKLRPDSYGLRYEMGPLPKTQTAEEVVELVAGGYVTGSSFAFAIKNDGSQRGDSWSMTKSGLRRREVRSIGKLEDVGPVVRPAFEASSVIVSRRAIEMALGDAYRPNQTMANAARKGLNACRGRDDVDQVLMGIAEHLVAREIVSVEEVEYLANVHERCVEARAEDWVGSPAWVEWKLAGGEAGAKWVLKRRASAAEPAEVRSVTTSDTVAREAPGSLKEGDYASWGDGVGRVEHVMPNGSVQGMTATEEDPLVVLTPYDDGEPEDHMVAKKMSSLTKVDEPAGQADEQRADVNLRPTAGMASAARRGLKLHEEGKSGDGLKPETVARANKIAARETLTEDHVREMNAWFARHEKASKSPGWDTPGDEKPGFVAWLLWAGNAGQRWAAAKVAQMDAQENRAEPEGGLSPHKKVIARVLEDAVDIYGQFLPTDVHYMAESPWIAQGMRCANCIFYEGGGACEIVAGSISPEALCQMHVIPEVTMSEQESRDTAVAETDAPPAAEPVVVAESNSVPAPSAEDVAIAATAVKAAELKAAVLRTRLQSM